MANIAQAYPSPSETLLPLHRFTVEEYHRMGEMGILTEEDRVELLEGWIVEKMIHRPPHDAVIELVEAAIRGLLPTGWRIRIQSVISTADSESEPDLAIVRGPIRAHLERHPRPHEIGLVIEVADTSLKRDRAKTHVYACAGIAVYWIINLVDSQIEVYRKPNSSQGFYQLQNNYGTDDSVPLTILDQQLGEIAVAEVLP